MSAPPETLGLAEAAERLGVHYMTAYRYVRTGLLPAEQTGGQWRVAEADVAAFESGKAAGTTAKRAADARSVTPGGMRRRAQALTARLAAGDQSGAWSIVQSALVSGAGPSDVYLRMLSPALAEIGERWAAGDLSVGGEHRATGVATRLIGRLGSTFARPGRTRGSIVLAGAPGDRHGLPTAMLADLLRARGFAVVDLGADTPAADLAAMAAAEDRLVALGVCATTPLTGVSQRHLRRMVRLAQERTGCPVLVGGAAVDSADVAAGLGADHWSTSAEDAQSWFEAVASGRPAGSSGRPTSSSGRPTSSSRRPHGAGDRR